MATDSPSPFESFWMLFRWRPDQAEHPPHVSDMLVELHQQNSDVNIEPHVSRAAPTELIICSQSKTLAKRLIWLFFSFQYNSND